LPPGLTLLVRTLEAERGLIRRRTKWVALPPICKPALTPPMCCSGWVQDWVQLIAEEYIGAAGRPRSKPDVDGTVSFSNFAVKRFALPDDAAFVSVGCIPARFVYQVFQPHIIALAICMHVEP
jgi:hypothetical protein